MNTSDFDYHLPPELIAQAPLPVRDQSRMMVLRRADGSIRHSSISELPAFVDPGDLLVLNNTKVFPARVYGTRNDTRGKVELLLVEETSPGEWNSFYRASSAPKAGMALTLASGRLTAEVTSVLGDGRITVRLSGTEPVMTVLDQEGCPPLPPYIHRPHEKYSTASEDVQRYQTIYARHTGAVAAPTAGLHFTEDLFSRLASRGVKRATLTLHVGPGTFKPVKPERVEDHVMEAERYDIGPEAAEAVRTAKAAGRRVIAVGSTSMRTLEAVAAEHGSIAHASGRTSIFIHPPYQFRVADAMLTNFHLPKSTLIMMISAFAGREFILRAYTEAVNQKYRFYSYGDCMLIL